ncbi:MAG: DinB family protein [Bacteroidetes bacterium]|nr:DinB family protein [Bacteroidota bacterium]MBI3481658.1 DinB family protein [Bacteroidota bacterium]
MNSRLQSLFDSIETQRHLLLSALKDLPFEKLNQHLPNKWSINQIVAHLISAEQLSVRYISKKILGIHQTNDTGLYEELKMILLQISQRIPLKYRAPKKVVENTLNEQDIHKLIGQWDLVRNDLKNILEKIEDHQIKRGIYRHVRVGMINIQHAVKFFGEHVIHHTPQIKRLL